jgi:ankyrin repeat protein
MLACEYDSPVVTAALLTKGANVTIANSDGATALVFAVASGSMACTEMLLKVNPSLLWYKDQYGMNALDWAVIEDQ